MVASIQKSRKRKCLYVCNFFNGICDLFVMVLVFYVMFFLCFFFSRVASLFLYNAF